MNVRSTPSIRIEEKNGRLLIGERKDLLPNGGSLITRFKLKNNRNSNIIYFWQYLEDDNSFPQPSLLEELVDSIGIGNRVPSYKVVIRDSEGIPAFTLLVPRYWMHNGFVDSGNELVFSLRDNRGIYSLNILSSTKYFYVDNTWMANHIVQSLMANGYQYAPYTRVLDYASKILGITVYDALEVSPPQILSPYIGEIMAAKSTGLWGDIESKILVAENKVLWMTIYGFQIPFLPARSFLAWGAHLVVMSGQRDPELLRNLLLSIISHVRLNPGWVRRKIRENNARARALIQSIRSNRIRPVSLSTSSTSSYGSSYPSYGYSANSREEYDSGLSDTLGSLWETDLSDTADQGGLSDYDWAGGQGTFYIDNGGHIRSYDYGEEMVADYIGSDGTLYDENDNPVGLVDEGYIYDNEGNRIGRIDLGSSDSWWNERYEQEIPGYEKAMGQTPFGANNGDYDEEITPYYVSKRNKDD